MHMLPCPGRMQNRMYVSRGRTTRRLIELARERFSACDECAREAYDYLEETLRRLRLSPQEYRRLRLSLTCLRCDRRLNDPYFQRVVAYSAEELRVDRRHQAFVTKHAKRFEAFQRFLLAYPLLGGLHPFGRELAQAVRRARIVRLEPATWYRRLKITGVNLYPYQGSFRPIQERLFAKPGDSIRSDRWPTTLPT